MARGHVYETKVRYTLQQGVPAVRLGVCCLRACDPNRKVVVRERVELHNFVDNDGEGERLPMNRRLLYD